MFSYNKKYSINQIDWDDMSFDNPAEAAHYVKLNNLYHNSPEGKNLIRNLKNSKKNPDDENTYSCSISAEGHQITIPTEH